MKSRNQYYNKSMKFCHRTIQCHCMQKNIVIKDAYYLLELAGQTGIFENRILVLVRSDLSNQSMYN